MPVKSYFKGRGDTIMRSMVSRYGEKKAKRVFYGKVNKDKKMAPSTRKM